MSINKMLILAVLISVSILSEDCFVYSSSLSLPKSFLRCKKDDPNLGQCLQKAVPDAFQKIKNHGIPSLGVFPLEPLRIEEIKLDSGTPDSPVNLKLRFKNMNMYGIPATTLTDYQVNLNETVLYSVAHSPVIKFVAEYVADGRVLLLPVKGNGHSNITMYDLKTICKLIFEPQEKNGETYWIIQKFVNKFMPKKMMMNFDGLLNKDKALNEGINNFINQNWEPVFEGVRAEFESAFGEIFKEITSRVFSKVPINKIFID